MKLLENRPNIKKDFIWNTIGTTIFSFNSLFFMIIVTRINGVDKAGLFTFAFSLASLFQVIANYSGRTFQVTNSDKNIKDSDFLYNRLTTSVFMIILVILYLGFKNYDFYKNIIIILFVIYRLIESLCDSLYAVIQQNEKLYKVGFSLFLKGIISIVIFFLVDYFTNNIILSILSIILVNILIMIFYDIKNCSKIFQHTMYSKKINYNLLKSGFFVFGFTFLTHYILNAPKYAIDEFLNNEMQAIYGIIIMPASILILCGQLIVQPFLVKIKKLIRANDKNELIIFTMKISLFIFLIGFICILLAYFLGIPVLNILYGINLNKYLISLLIVILGATFYSISFVFSSVLTAMRKTFVQIIFYIISSIFISFLSNVLVINYQVIGACLSYLFIMFLLLLLYAIYFLIIMRKKV